jgi:hypothetical protein
MLKKILSVGGVLTALVLLGVVLAVAITLPVFAQTAIALQQRVLNNGYGLASWEALAKHTAGDAASVGAWRGVKTVQVIVTAAGEQNLTIQGSMDGTNWVTLHGVSLDSGAYFELTAITASGLYAIIEDPLYVRPLVSNEAGATAVDIDVIVGAYAR